MEDAFAFKTPERIIPKRVGVVLDALLPYQVAVDASKLVPLDTTSAYSVTEMDEEAVTAYLHTFYVQLESGTTSRESLLSHRLFQAVLARANEMSADAK